MRAPKYLPNITVGHDIAILRNGFNVNRRSVGSQSNHLGDRTDQTGFQWFRSLGQPGGDADRRKLVIQSILLLPVHRREIMQMCQILMILALAIDYTYLNVNTPLIWIIRRNFEAIGTR